MNDSSPLNVGKVYLVGAGPGDPGLITLRGVERLAQSDLVLYDYLVNPIILKHASRQAELVCLGRHGRDRIIEQDEINARMVAAALAGRTVVRLKGGDPIVFARIAEELDALEQAGVPYEIVPGITAALAAGSYAGIPLTHRGLASAVALVTGHEQEGKDDEPLDYGRLASFPGTLVFYMGVTKARQWTSALMAAGKPASTPAAIVRRCSWPDQATVTCTLATVAAELESRKVRPPVLVIVGPVSELAPVASWFTARPLFGRRIVVTRPEDQAEELATRFRDLGADCLVGPAIEISPPSDWSAVDKAIAALGQFDWIVFSSSNGVRFFFDRLLELGRDLRALRSVRIATIGPGTSAELSRYHLNADVQPDEFRAESLAAALAAEAAGKSFLLVRASRGREVLAEQLTAAGGKVHQVVAYESTDVDEAEPELVEMMQRGQIDWVTVTSSAIARSLVRLFGDSLRSTRLVSISPITTGVLAELGYPPSAEAREYTMAGVVDAVLRAEPASGNPSLDVKPS